MKTSNEVSVQKRRPLRLFVATVALVLIMAGIMPVQAAANDVAAALTANAPISGRQSLSGSVVALADRTQVEGFVIRFYQSILNRTPDVGGLAYWTDSLISQERTGADVARDIVLSAEFLARNLNNDAYVTVLYHAFFGREPETAGMNYWTLELYNSMSRYYVLSNFVNSAEFEILCAGFNINPGELPLTNAADRYRQLTLFTNRFYKYVLNRTADESGINYWVAALHNGTETGATIAANFFLSPEMYAWNPSNGTFVARMYRVLFNRDPEFDALAYWTGVLDAGATRYSVLAWFVSSPEFSDLCQSYGIVRGTLR